MTKKSCDSCVFKGCVELCLNCEKQKRQARKLAQPWHKSLSEMYCPTCGSTSTENEEEAMEGVYMYHRHYCQVCGCSFKVLRKANKK